MATNLNTTTSSSANPVAAALLVAHQQRYQAAIGTAPDACTSALIFASDFALTSIEQHPNAWQTLMRSGDLNAPRPENFYATFVPEFLCAALAATAEIGTEAAAKNAANAEADVMRALRHLRRQEMLRWIYRDANNLCTVPELTQELSDFADAAIHAALQYAHAQLATVHGEPVGAESGAVQQLCVIGMGKLGAHELNLSSDIDLIFCYPENGDTTGVPNALNPSQYSRSISNQEFFVRVGQKLIKILDAITADGFVFRVDMRLRPWGDGSALATSFAAMETYYEQHGREWERYALIKARVCAGDALRGQELMRALMPFVFRRYIDFGVFESLRDMKALIEREVRRKGMDNNIKLGSGGIREVEFVVQAFQLIRGGVDKYLQRRELLPVLGLLGHANLLPADAVENLRAAYIFLRKVEHRIQALRDQQTQELPSAEIDQLRVALSLGFSAWPDFYAALTAHRQQVEAQFKNVIVQREESADHSAQIGSAIWLAAEEDMSALLSAQNFTQAQLSAQKLLTLRDSRAARVMQDIGRERLNKLMPLLLQMCATQTEPDVALARCLPLIESVLRRSAYLVLLIENHEALKRLVSLCAASPWIAEELARFPVLLDELLNAHTLFAPPQKTVIAAELRQILLRIPEDDTEAQMEALRIFKKGQVLRVAASDITGTLPLMKVSDYLSWLAEAVLAEVLQVAWRHLTAKHGCPQRADGTLCSPDFIIVGYGKLGGIELGYGSDLDIVFIHDSAESGETNGEKPLDNASFFARLGQKIIALLTTATAAGYVYEVDLRLRPSGSAGMLVCSLAAFAAYQENSAWTWEHQALVRARVVAGDERVAAAFNEVRERILKRARNQTDLRADVVAMRNKMRAHLSSDAPGKKGRGFDLKHDLGGIVDIEFMVQYGVLAWAHESPELTRYPDNVRILESLATRGFLQNDAAVQLRDAYLQYRARGHRLALSQKEATISDDDFQEERASVVHWWNQLLSSH